jgi:hypothetical protein
VTFQKKAPLEERIRDLEKECLRYISDWAKEQHKSAPGVPAVVIENQLMTVAGSNPFRAVRQIVETRRKDQEIAERQQKSA